MTEHALFKLLEKRYPAPQYATLPQVRSTTGYSSAIRTADALVMGLWPSRGMELMGVEMKSSRSDWLAELKNPAKAETIAKYCDRWWVLVADAKFVQPGELPVTWGLLAPDKSGTKLRVVTEAPALEAAPMPRNFLAAILRNVQEYTARCTIPREGVAAEIAAAREAGKVTGETSKSFEIKRLQEQIQRLQCTIIDFETHAGIKIDRWNSRNLAEDVKLAQVLRQNGPAQLEYAARSAEAIANAIREALPALQAAVVTEVALAP